MNGYLTPMVISREGNNERAMDIFSKLLDERIIFVSGPVTQEMATSVTAQLLFLESTGKDRDITMYINSPGGSVYAGLAMVDTMNYIKCDVATVCMGMAASMGSVLLASGTKGKRFILPDATVMIHQVSSGSQGTVMDQERAFNEAKRLNDRLHHILAAASNGITYKRMKELCSRDHYMSAEETLGLGLVDQIITHNPNK